MEQEQKDMNLYNKNGECIGKMRGSLYHCNVKVYNMEDVCVGEIIGTIRRGFGGRDPNGHIILDAARNRTKPFMRMPNRIDVDRSFLFSNCVTIYKGDRILEKYKFVGPCTITCAIRCSHSNNVDKKWMKKNKNQISFNK